MGIFTKIFDCTQLSLPPMFCSFKDGLDRKRKFPFRMTNTQWRRSGSRAVGADCTATQGGSPLWKAHNGRGESQFRKSALHCSFPNAVANMFEMLPDFGKKMIIVLQRRTCPIRKDVKFQFAVLCDKIHHGGET